MIKQLSSFAVLSVEGGDRVSFTFNEINENTGELIARNTKRSFYAVDPELLNHIHAIQNYIKTNQM